MKIISRVFFWLFMTLIATAVTLGSAYPAIRGWVPLTVLTGSMEGTLSPGDLVVVAPLEGSEQETVKVNDIVSYYPLPDSTEGLTTHRIIDRQESADGSITYTTKGDANGAPDSPIMAKQVAGKMIYSLPKLGFVAKAMPGEAKPIIVVSAAILLLGYAGAQVVQTVRESRTRRKAGEASE